MYIERIKKIYIGYFLLYVLAVAIIAGAYLWLEFEQDVALHKATETTQIELVTISIVRDLENILPDLTLMAGNSTILDYLKSGDTLLYDRLIAQFQAFATQKRIYSTVRVLDKSGLERLRMEYSQGKALAVEPGNFQNKSTRLYFQDAIGLRAGELYISPMDLNVQRDEIEIPFKPALRFATPIVDQNGENQGVIVLNYLAGQLIQHFDEMLVSSGRHVALLNEQGYWLHSHNKGREWGFMLDKDWVYSKTRPDEWRQISARNKGQFMNKKGLFTFSSIYPLELLNKNSNENFDFTNRVAHQYGNPKKSFWKIVSEISRQSMQQDVLARVFGRLIFASILALILGLITITLLARLRTQREVFQGQLELHAMLYANTTEGVMITDNKGCTIDINDAFEKITLYSRDDVIGQNPRILSSGRQDKQFYADMWSDLNTKGAWEGEITNRRKDGTLIVEWLRIYVIKDDNGEVVNNVAVFSDITGKKLTEEEMLRRAHHDPLTGLANRLLFDERLQQDLARARRNENNLALLFIDLDKFKPINDKHGHHAGDEVLLEVARRLLKELREVDTVARVGGDEFVVILAELTTLQDIDIVTQRILQSLRKPIYVNNKVLYISASIGISLFPDHGETERELIANADKAMYDVKRNYHDGYGYFGAVNELGSNTTDL